MLNNLLKTIALAVATSTLGASLAVAQGFPSKPIRYVVPYPAGGGSDIIARLLATPVSQDLGKPVVVENKAGANGAIAANEVARADADGHTILNSDNAIQILNPALYSKLGYNVEDLKVFTVLGKFPMILLAGPAIGNDSFQSLIEKIKQAPGKYSFGSAGAGGPHHMGFELFRRNAGLDMVHIPYKGSAPALADLVGGTIPLMMGDFASAQSFIKSGKARPLAVANQTRLPYLPDVPTFAELGIQNAEAAGYVMLATAKDVPDANLEILNRSFANAMRSDAAKARFGAFGIEPVPDATTPASARAFVNKEIQKWHRLIKDLKLSLE